MTTADSKGMDPDLRRELEARLTRKIGEGLDEKVQGMRQRREGGVLPEVLERLDIHVPPTKNDNRRLHRAPPLPLHQFNLRGGQLIGPTTWVYVPVPHYDFVAQNQDHDGDPDQLAVIADPVTTELNLALHIENHNSWAWGFAGVGSWYVPRVNSPAMVSFNALLQWSYHYTLEAGFWGKPSHSRGEIGVRVFSWNRQAEDEQELTDFVPLWEYGVDAGDTYHDASDSGLTALSRLVWPFDPDRHYAFAAYIFASCDATGVPGGSQANVDLLGQVPFLVTEEYTWS